MEFVEDTLELLLTPNPSGGKQSKTAGTLPSVAVPGLTDLQMEMLRGDLAESRSVSGMYQSIRTAKA